MIQPGAHKVKAVDVKLTEDEQVLVRLQVVGGLDTISWYLGLRTDKAIKFTRNQLRKMGWRGTDLLALKAEDIGKEVIATVVEETYPDKVTGEIKKSTKVKWVDDGSGPQVKEMSKDKAEILSEQMKAKFAALDELEGNNADDPLPF